MRDLLFTTNDLTEETLHYIDKYLKVTIMNAKRDYFRRENKSRKNGITFVTLEQAENDLVYDDPDLTALSCDFIEENGVRIPVINPALSFALKKLTSPQRTILLKNVVLKIPLEEISAELGICLRMTKKHKHNAIEAVKRSMKAYE